MLVISRDKHCLLWLFTEINQSKCFAMSLQQMELQVVLPTC